jgi:DNA (cytosine-5)-methyltransferase 1
MSISLQIGNILTGYKSKKLTPKHDRLGRAFLNGYDPTSHKHQLVLLEAVTNIKGLKYSRAYLSHWLNCPDLYCMEEKAESLYTALLDKVGSKVAVKPAHAVKFVDLFCGIGGFHLALCRHGAQCVFASDIDADAQATYYDNHDLWPFGNISDHVDVIPDHDVLCAGFPCQPFSMAGKQLGFNDTRGTLFFDILNIVRNKRPKALFLENVKNLVSHDSGRTFSVIKRLLEAEGYNIHHKVLNSKDFGIPQNRARIFIVAFKEPVKFEFPTYGGPSAMVGDILEQTVSDDYTISDKLWDGHQRRAIAHKAQHKGFRYSLFNAASPHTRTLTARYSKDGKEILLEQEGKNPRMLTPRECARLQGFPDTFKLTKHKSASYKQFGNSVTVPVVTAIAGKIISTLLENANQA